MRQPDHVSNPLTIFVASAGRECCIHDILVQELTPKLGVTYYHLYPGLVATNAMDIYQLRFPVYQLLSLAMWFWGTKPSQYAPVPVNVVLQRPSYHTIGATGKESPINAALKSEEIRNKVMKFLKEATGIESTSG